jgi:hypothetical protein
MLQHNALVENTMMGTRVRIVPAVSIPVPTLSPAPLVPKESIQAVQGAAHAPSVLLEGWYYKL